MPSGRRPALAISPPEKIGLSRAEAAGFIGVTLSVWDQMVLNGDMPAPRRYNSLSIWDRRQVEAAFAELPQDLGREKSKSPYADVA